MAELKFDTMMPSVADPSLLTSVPTIEDVLHDHARSWGHDFRLSEPCVPRRESVRGPAAARPESHDKIAVAARFHDLGIWTNQTFDYLPPSIALATRLLDDDGRPEWVRRSTMDDPRPPQVSASDGDPHWLVEPFRRADWVDVTRGRSFGTVCRRRSAPDARWLADAGFHRRLVQVDFAIAVRTR